MRFIATALLALGIFAPAFALAQSIGQVPLTLDIAPQYPRPYDTVNVAPASTAFDLSGASVTFFVDGKQVAQTTGTAPVSVPLGGPGSATTIKVTAKAGGQTYSATQVLHPAEVDLVTEPSSTSHPFYLGGLGVPSQGQVRLVAVADLRTSSGKAIDPSTLVYNWKFNGQALGDASGIGRSVLMITGPIRYRSATVVLTVASQDQSVVGQAVSVVSPTDPVLRVYENDPLLGVRYEHALPTEYKLAGSEESFTAVPYFFAKQPDLAWTVNGSPSGTDANITLRPTGTGAGTANVSVTATLAGVFTSAAALLRVSFGASTGTGIFGL
jgi:hypothetical protein